MFSESRTRTVTLTTVCLSVSITVKNLLGPKMTTSYVTAEYLSIEFTKSLVLVLQNVLVLGHNIVIYFHLTTIR